MTKDKVKELLPPVKVQIGKQIFDGHLSGRKNPFATVTVFGDYVAITGKDYVSYEYSWDTVTNAINADRPLKV